VVEKSRRTVKRRGVISNDASRNDFVKEQRKLVREKQKIVQSICDGVPAEFLKAPAVFINRF
jgi:hypothetical protein